MKVIFIHLSTKVHVYQILELGSMPSVKQVDDNCSKYMAWGLPSVCCLIHAPSGIISQSSLLCGPLMLLPWNSITFIILVNRRCTSLTIYQIEIYHWIEKLNAGVVDIFVMQRTYFHISKS